MKTKQIRIVIPALKVFFLICLGAMLGSCYNDKEELLYPGSLNPVDCSTVPARFSTDVQPIINTKCAISGCHDATAAGNSIFQNYNQVSAKKDRIYTRVVVEGSMPPTGR